MPEKAHSFYKRFTIILMIAFISTQCSDDDIIFEQFDPDVTAEFEVLPGFKVEIFQSELNLPTSIAFPPDGSERLFINELQTGNIRIVENGVMITKPFATVSTDVSGGFPVSGENGLIGITFDRDYINNRFVYITYAVRDGDINIGKVARLTDNNNTGEDFTILLDGLPSAPGHQIESLTFGPDGMLYVSIGDAFQEDQVQDIQTFHGKILRMNPDGSIPIDNPFPGSYTFAYGFRNCYDLVFRDNGDLLTTENGPERDDEFNVVEAGGNYGWPDVLGDQPAPGVIDPIHVWNQIVAPTGMMFYKGNQFPSQYKNKLFQVLFGFTFDPALSSNAKRIQTVTLTGEGQNTTPTFEDFLIYNAQKTGNPIDIAEGPDGRLYLSDIFQGIVFRITYSN